MRRPTAVLRIAALATSAALVVLSAAPGTAAQPLAKGTAVGLSLVVGGTANDSGAYTVTNDGSGETRSGARDPQIRALGGQSLISAGTLAQNAATTVTRGDGSVVACAGLAGDGATVAEVGEGDCLSPGNQLQLNAANFDLSQITVAEGESLGPLSDAAGAARSAPCAPRCSTRSTTPCGRRSPPPATPASSSTSAPSRAPARPTPGAPSATPPWPTPASTCSCPASGSTCSRSP